MLLGTTDMNIFVLPDLDLQKVSFVTNQTQKSLFSGSEDQGF